MEKPDELSKMKRDIEKIKKDIEDLYKEMRRRRPRFPLDIDIPIRPTGGLTSCYRPRTTGGLRTCYRDTTGGLRACYR